MLAPAHNFVVVKSCAGVAVVEEGGVPLHEGDGKLLEEVGDGDGLVLPSVQGERATKLLDLNNSCFVPAA